MYRFVDAAVVRAATQTPGSGIPPYPDLTGSTDEQVAQWCSWLHQVWAVDGVAAAVEVASPVLARRVRQVCEGRLLPARQMRRVAVSMLRYLLRATSRATPFGLFAGVAPGGTPTIRRLDASARTRRWPRPSRCSPPIPLR